MCQPLRLAAQPCCFVVKFLPLQQLAEPLSFGAPRALLRNAMLRNTVHENGAVFSKQERKRFIGAFLAAALLILAASLTSKGAELNPETLKAWDTYVKAQNTRVAEYSNGMPFLWSDQSPDRLRRLHNGETVVAPFGENPHRVSRGLIHHWIGAIFLPGTRLDNVLSVVRDYGRYKDFYAPNVIESALLRQTDTEDTFSLRMLNKAVVAKFAIDMDFENTFTRIDENRVVWHLPTLHAFVRSRSTVCRMNTKPRQTQAAA